ncbi:MAG: bifunctional allantoicase/(S)-ureidoglycine aminohydrolase [Pseudomonadota bacterium]
MNYYTPPGGLPVQETVMTDRAIFTTAYAVIPKGVMTDIVTSVFPGWDATRGWVLARPMTGFAETFAQTIMEVQPGGGSEMPEPDGEAQGAYFVVEGTLTIAMAGETHKLKPGGFAYLPPGAIYSVSNASTKRVVFHWIRKAYEPVPGLPAPQAIFSSDKTVAARHMANTDAWSTTRFMDPEDLSHDMHVTVVTFQPGGSIPFAETHVMEHGLYVLEGKGVYRLNGDWVEVEAGDFMWLRAFCPQACVAAGPDPFRYLLYKDVNRHPKLRLP